jgi:hypothetical protein
MIRARFEFKPADLWVGVFWRRDDWGVMRHIDVWLCLLPMLPLHVTVTYRAVKTPWGRCVMCGTKTAELRRFTVLRWSGVRASALWCGDCVGRSTLQWEKGELA